MLTEQYIQSKIIKELERNGYYVLKLVKTNKNGIPDVLAIKDGKKPIFIEVKREKGGVISELQKYRIDELRDQGFEAYVTNGKEKLY